MTGTKSLLIIDASLPPTSSSKGSLASQTRRSRPSLASETVKVPLKQRRLRAREQEEVARLLDQLVAKRIRARRLQKGLTQQQLAERVGVASQQVHKYESGISRITAGRLSQIADALGFSVDAFFQYYGGAAESDPGA